jgi:ribonuclease P protein component
VVGPLGIEKKNNLEKSELPYFSIERLKDRSDFLKIAKGKVVHKKSFVLQGRKRFGSLQNIRVGFTCSKKVGNAVLRNLAKRRLREISRDILPKNGSNGWDYVLIGRKDHTAELNLNLMAKELKEAVHQLHAMT